MSVSPASLSGADARGEAAMKKPKAVQGCGGLGFGFWSFG